MNAVVIYGSRYGSTKRVAEAIVTELRKHGEAQLMTLDEVPAVFAGEVDLVVVGGPTEAHRMTEPLTLLFDRIAGGALDGKAAAAFDTRVRWPMMLSGSAAAGIERKLEHAGALVISPPASFFVSGKPTALEPGQLEQATAWAASLASKLEARKPVLSAR